MKKILFFGVLGVGILLGACATPPEDLIDPDRKPSHDGWKAYPAAKAGDPQGLRNYFAAARAQLTLPFVNAGEDAEALLINMINILETVGDDSFAEALLREEPESRSAVREFLIEEETRSKFPLSHQILVDAPIVKWPSDVADERSYIEDGKVPPAKDQWTP